MARHWLGEILRVGRLPLQAMALAGATRAFTDNPLLGSERLNRHGLHAGRVALAQRGAAARRWFLAGGASAEDRATFARDGILVKRDWLPPERFARLQAELLGLRAPAREHVQGDALNRLIALPPEVTRPLPETRAVLASREWRGLLAYVAASRQPPLTFLQSIFAQHRQAPPDPQVALHSDTFFPTMKAWLYLDDVGEAQGPFQYVAGSHRATPARQAWEKARSLAWREADAMSQRGSLRVGLEELAGLGLGQPVRHAVPANTLVVADTHGFHARSQGQPGTVRIALWAQAESTPFLPVPLPSVRSLLGGREAVLAWAVTDWLAVRGLAHRHWLDRGLLRAGDPPLAEG